MLIRERKEPAMPSDSETRIAALLRETESAHGAYETTVLGGVRDEDWAAWYATYLLDHGLGELLPGLESSGAKSLATTLVQLNDDVQRLRPAEEWPEFYARRMVEAV
jgi:cobalamin biosynthesis Mg chelatase CobN